MSGGSGHPNPLESGGVAWRRRSPTPSGGRHRLANASSHAIEIHLYGTAEPIHIPLRRTNRAAAEAYLELVKSDVIKAQRHGRRHLWLRPLDRKQDAQSVDPREIQRMVLVDHLSTNVVTDAAPDGRAFPPMSEKRL